MKTKLKSIDDYLSRLPDEQRAALERLRGIIRKAVPRAEEVISYQMPAFRVDGRVVVWFGASKNHCSFFPGGIVDDFADELEGFVTRKGTVHFQPEKPLPATLVRKMLKAAIARRSAKS